MEGLPSGSDVSSGEDEDGDDSDEDFMARKRDRGEERLDTGSMFRYSAD